MSEKIHISIINGPNLNMLGIREHIIYGTETFKDLNLSLQNKAKKLNVNIEIFQSNYEGDIIEKIHKIFQEKTDGIIINPGAFTHYSIAIRDALLLLSCPIIELHISNIYKREPFRHKSVISDVVTGQITGLGILGYHIALDGIVKLIKTT